MAVVEEMDPITAPHPWYAPAWPCALVTIVAVPLSFLGVVSTMTAGQENLNAPAIVVHFFLCLVLALPLALVNSLLIAPGIARAVHGRLPAIGSHLILTLVWAGLVFSQRFVLLQFPATPNWFLSWLWLFWNLADFLGPAVIAGSFVYSLKYNSMRRKLAPCA